MNTTEFLFGFTRRMYDIEVGLQNNLHRWYDAVVGAWISQDPIGFEAGDANLYRYVGNGSTLFVDPSGLNYFDPNGKSWLGDRIYDAWSYWQDNEDIADTSDAALKTATTIVCIPIGVGIFAGGEAALGVGYFGAPASHATTARPRCVSCQPFFCQPFCQPLSAVVVVSRRRCGLSPIEKPRDGRVQHRDRFRTRSLVRAVAIGLHPRCRVEPKAITFGALSYPIRGCDAAMEIVLSAWPRSSK